MNNRLPAIKQIYQVLITLQKQSFKLISDFIKLFFLILFLIKIVLFFLSRGLEFIIHLNNQNKFCICIYFKIDVSSGREDKYKVLMLDGNLEVGAHVRSNLYYLI